MKYSRIIRAIIFTAIVVNGAGVRGHPAEVSSGSADMELLWLVW